MGLTKYVAWSRSIADELLDLLTSQDRDRLMAIVQENSQSRPWRDVRQRDLDDAIRFLSAAPSRRQARWNKMHPDDRLVLWLRARSLGLQSANAIQLAERLEAIDGMTYRDAVRDTAQCVFQFDVQPQLGELLGLDGYKSEH